MDTRKLPKKPRKHGYTASAERSLALDGQGRGVDGYNRGDVDVASGGFFFRAQPLIGANPA